MVRDVAILPHQVCNGVGTVVKGHGAVRHLMIRLYSVGMKTMDGRCCGCCALRIGVEIQSNF